MPVKSTACDTLRAAMRRLLDGSAEQTNGELTWANVFREAGVPRATANRAKEVIAEWHTAIAARTEQVPSDQVPAQSPGQENERAGRSAATNRDLRRTVEVMASHIHAITLALRRSEKEAGSLRDETARLQVELARVQGSANVTAFPSTKQ